MKLTTRISLLAGLAAALTLPVAAQDVEPQPVLEDDAVPVSAPPAGEALTLPPLRLVDPSLSIAAEGPTVAARWDAAAPAPCTVRYATTDGVEELR